MKRKTKHTTNPEPITRADFVRLYEAHLTAVFNYCLFRVGDHQQAEDLTADIFERVWQKRQHYDPVRGAFTTWLFAIARHRVADSRRRQVQRPVQPLNGQQIDHRPPPEEQAARREQLAGLNQALQELPAQQQELIALKFGAGLTNRYIARLLGKRETAVGSALHRIMKKLRSQLGVGEGFK